MKTKLVLLAVCVVLFSVFANAKIKDGQAMTGNSLSELGQYKITHSELPIVFNNQVLETYDLTYENATNTVRIAVYEENKCRNFIVRSDEFEAQYACNNGVFGVKKVEKRFQEIPEAEVSMKLDRVGYYAQRVICQNKKSLDEYLGLIACYFPDLMKEDYQANF